MSDANTAGSGFLAVYSAAHPHQRGEQYCGGRLDKSTGSFKTPNWPEKDYPAGVTCSWHILAPKHQIIEVRFEKFDVERDNYCRYDHVSIFNGPEINDARRIGKFCGDSPPAVVVFSFRFIDLESDNLCRYDYVDVYSGHTGGQRLGRFCGTSRPGALVATGNKMMVQMMSDANTAGSGFLAVYSAAHPHQRGEQYCGGRLDKSTGSFKTPNWPEKDYPAGVTCSWHILAPKHQIIEVRFEKFDVERDNYCRYDHVSIFNGPEINDARRIGKFCGDSPPAKRETMSTKITILCRKCPLVRRGTSYLFMGQAGEDGRGTIAPQNLVTAFNMVATVSILNLYKEGGVAIQQAGKTMSTKITILCRKCPLVRRGTSYLFMGQAGEDGRGTIAPQNLVTAFNMVATVSILNLYKEGGVAIQQAGKTMSTKITILCRKCPLVRRGTSYLFMGQAGEDGRGTIAPQNLVTAFKSRNQKDLSLLKTQRC
ncbi:hypothetical protein CRUP_019962 [Coryphaenoides rupestris]|nr:hypothetical protein CRUP_019962 [Coryphaenoides rupestris]